MIADWSVEAGAESPHIAVPWQHWSDLCNRTAEDPTPLAECIVEIRDYPELAPLLLLANTGDTFTVKVDVFPVTREDADPEIGEAGMDATAYGLGSYLDLLTPRLDIFNAFAVYEAVTRNAVRGLHAQQQKMCAVELILRPAQLYDSETFGWSLYTLGFGQTDAEARMQWAQAFRIALGVLKRCIREWIDSPPRLHRQTLG